MFGRFRPCRLSPKVEAQQCNGAKAIPHSPLIRSIPDIHPGHTALQGSTSIIFLTHPQYFGWALDVMYGITFILHYIGWDTLWVGNFRHTHFLRWKTKTEPCTSLSLHSLDLIQKSALLPQCTVWRSHRWLFRYPDETEWLDTFYPPYLASNLYSCKYI